MNLNLESVVDSPKTASSSIELAECLCFRSINAEGRLKVRHFFACVMALFCLLSNPFASAAEKIRGVSRIDDPQTSGRVLSDAYSASYALLVGVSNYQHAGWGSLPSISSELVSVESMLVRQGFEVQTLSDPTGRELKEKLSDFVAEKGFDENNRLLVYFSGHGETVELSEGRPMGYFVPADAPPYLADNHRFFSRALSMNRVMAMAKEIRSKHAMFVFDSCFSGSIFQTRSFGSSGGQSLQHLLNKPVRYFITSGSANEAVPAVGVFTEAFIDSIEGGTADLNRDGFVTSTELGLHLTQNVPFASQTPQHGKIHDYRLSRGDMVFRSFVSPDELAEPQGVSVARIHQDIQLQAELLYWRSLQVTPSIAGYREYLKKYPSGQFLAFAKQALAKLEAADLDEPSKHSMGPMSVGIAPTKILGAAMHWEVNFSSEREVTAAVNRVLLERLERHGLEPLILSSERGSGGWVKRKRSQYGIDREVYRTQTTQGQSIMGVVVRMRDDNSAGELKFVLSSIGEEKVSKRFYFQGEASLRRATNKALDQVFESSLDVVMNQ